MTAPTPEPTPEALDRLATEVAARTPFTTGDVREVFVIAAVAATAGGVDEDSHGADGLTDAGRRAARLTGGKAFDAWLAAHDAQVRAEAPSPDRLRDLQDAIEEELDLGGDASTLVVTVTNWLADV